MKTKAKAAVQAEIKEILKEYGYVQSERSSAIFSKIGKDGQKYRYKFNPNALRKEVEVKHSEYPATWIRVGGGFYKDVEIVEINGKKKITFKLIHQPAPSLTILKATEPSVLENA